MVVRISRTENPETHRLLLRVEGALTREGAQLLVQQCIPFVHDAEWDVEIDLTAVTFIDEAAAAVVHWLNESPSVSLTGCQLFTQQMIEAVPSEEGNEAREWLRLHPPRARGARLGHRSDTDLALGGEVPSIDELVGATKPKEDFMSEVNTSQNSVMINPDDAVMLLIDHQSGLFNLVKDIPVPDLRRNVIALAKVATLLKIPVITTASVPDGPNGPLIPEIHQTAPHAQYVAREGQINAWDMPTFVKAIEDTGRKTLIMAATLTSVCLAFPSISAVAAGYKVYGVVDACGNWSKMATDLTIARIMQAGVIPIDTLAVISELQRTWNRLDALQYAHVFADYIMPNYRLLMESYQKAQDVVRSAGT